MKPATITAKFENGVFVPLEKIKIKNNGKYSLLVMPFKEKTAPPKKLAQQIERQQKSLKELLL